MTNFLPRLGLVMMLYGIIVVGIVAGYHMHADVAIYVALVSFGIGSWIFLGVR